jgi:small GTP-binding protein
MTEVVRKVCLLGDFGVGKTSLVARFVSDTFSDKYLTTVGVKTETRRVVGRERTVKLVLWDIAGRDSLDLLRLNYLRGSSGLVLVADGTRAGTLDSARQLYRQACAEIGEVPAVLMVNKFDLLADWEISPDQLARVRGELPLFETSALNGEGVEAAFEALCGVLP